MQNKMYSTTSFQLTTDEFNYLLPVLKNKLSERGDKYYFIADSIDSLEDMLLRLKGVYDNYDDLDNMVILQCSRNGNLDTFRKSIN